MGAGAKIKGYIKNTKTGEIKSLMFNPETLSDSQSVKYKTFSSPCSSYPVVSYTGTGERTINVDIFLYGKPAEVQGWIDWINKDVNPKNQWDVPPVYIYALGTYVHNVVITSIKRKFDMWNEQLQLRQATLTISFMEV